MAVPKKKNSNVRQKYSFLKALIAKKVQNSIIFNKSFKVKIYKYKRKCYW